MLPYIHIGPVMLQLPGLALLLGLWLGLEVASRQALRLRLSGETISNLVLLGLLGGVVGARLGYAARYPEAFVKAPLSLLALNPQTLDAATGLVVGLAVAWLYAQRKHLPFRPTLDALAPGLAVMALFVGVAHVLSGDAYGMPTSLPWGVTLWGARRHPTQVYEVLLSAGVLVAIWRLSRQSRGDGTLFLATAGLLAAVRMFVEAFRGDSVTIWGGVRVAEVVAWLVLLAALWLYPRWRASYSQEALQEGHASQPRQPARRRGRSGRRNKA